MKRIRKKNGSPVLRISHSAVSAVLAALLLCSVAAAQTYETTTGVNFREGPSGDSPLIRVLPQGERVEKTGSSGGFVKVKTGQGEEGYIYGSYLRRVVGKGSKVPEFDEFAADLEFGPRAVAAEGPKKYFFESVLEFLRIENQPIYVMVLPLLAAIAVGVAGILLLKRTYGWADTVLPAKLEGQRRKAARVLLLVLPAYALVVAVGYFLDLSLHYASLEENTALAMVLMIPRVALALPVAAIDAVAGNWITGAAAVILLILIIWPGFKGPLPPAKREEEYDTLPRFSKTPASEPRAEPEVEEGEDQDAEQDEGEESKQRSGVDPEADTQSSPPAEDSEED